MRKALFTLLFSLGISFCFAEEYIGNYDYSDDATYQSQKPKVRKKKITRKRKLTQKPVRKKIYKKRPQTVEESENTIQEESTPTQGEDKYLYWWEEPVKNKEEAKPKEVKRETYNYQPKSSVFDENTRRRVIGEHIFPTTVLFPSPIPSARFGFSQGYLTKEGKLLEISDDNKDGIIQSGEIYRNSYNYKGLSEIFDGGIVLHNNVALDLNAQIFLQGGMEKKDLLSIEASPQGDARIGPIFSYKLENNLLLSFAPRYYLSKGINVSAAYGVAGMFDELTSVFNDPGFQELVFEVTGEDPSNYTYFDDVLARVDTIDELFTIVGSTYVYGNLSDIIKGFTKNVVVNTNRTAISPSLGFAYPINKYLGIQGIIEYQKIKETYKTKSFSYDEKYSQLNFGTGVSIDFKHLINFPLGGIFEYSRQKNKTTGINNYALGVYYQGIGEIQLGLSMKLTKAEYKYSGNKESYSQKLIQFMIGYFF